MFEKRLHPKPAVVRFFVKRKKIKEGEKVIMINKVKFRALGQHLYSNEYFVARLLEKMENIRVWIRMQKKKDTSKKIDFSALTEYTEEINQKLEQLKRHMDKEKEHYTALCREQGWEDILKQVQNVESSLYSTHLDMRVHPHIVQEYNTEFKTYKKQNRK
ncbi:MAG: hypothetical protein KKA79_00860 [Nanoarchaeota archaeon]|nr:hypothetical protein [Nanoarchaeota archaeon]